MRCERCDFGFYAVVGCLFTCLPLAPPIYRFECLIPGLKLTSLLTDAYFLDYLTASNKILLASCLTLCVRFQYLKIKIKLLVIVKWTDGKLAFFGKVDEIAMILGLVCIDYSVMVVVMWC